jgi:hypothetical protein
MNEIQSGIEEVGGVSWVLTDQHITVSLGGKTHMLARTDAQASALISALKDKRYDEVLELVSKAMMIERYTEGTFKVEDGSVLVDGEEVHGALAGKIIEFHSAGLPYEPLLAFARNVRKNPNKRAADDLFAFLDANKHPITDDGCFLAYRKVRRHEDGVLRDIHTGTMDNSVGQVVEVPRAEVNDDPEVSCSRGLHACSWHYFGTGALGSSGNDVFIEVKISPERVVAFPRDYGLCKMRVAKFEVLREVSQPQDGLYRDTASELDDCDD